MTNTMREGIKLLKESKYNQALSVFLKVEDSPKDYGELSYYLGLCYTHLERYDEALLYLEQVINSNLGFYYSFQSRMIIAYIYTNTKRYTLATFELNKLLESGYESAQTYSALAYIEYEQGNAKESLRLLKNALSLEEDNMNALNSMGYILADTEMDLDKALEYCKKAVSKNPRNPAYLDSLGWAYYKKGNLKEAKNYLQRAINLAPKNSVIWSHYEKVSSSS